MDVYRNGVRLAAADYTATTGTTVVLASAASAGDTITTESFYVSSVLNAIPATNNSVQQTYLASGVAGTGPAFSAYKSANQTISSGVDTKLTFDLEEFDTANCFDTSTGRFTPNVAGYYQFNFECDMGGIATTAGIMNIRKNGVGAKRGQGVIGPSMSEQYLCGSALMYMNGTTDYAEVYAYGLAAGSITIYGASSVYSYFQGFLARAA